MNRVISVKVIGPSRPITLTRFFTLQQEMQYLFIGVEHHLAASYAMILLFDPHMRLRVQLLSGAFKEENSTLLHRQYERSSCGTVPGPLPSGPWHFEILLPPNTPSLSMRISLETGQKEPSPIGSVPRLLTSWMGQGADLSFDSYPWERKKERGRAWYTGDVHVHTSISDGRLSPQELSSLAQERGLQFYVITEHNLFHTGLSREGPLVIPGVEITALQGHFNVLGSRGWLDWRYSCNDGGCETEAGMNRLLREAKRGGSLTCINHPFLKPWAWEFQDTALKNIDALEIINDPTYPGNGEATEKALKLWDTLWQEGYRIWGVGGSDCHLRPSERNPGAQESPLIGYPTTAVLAEDLSANSILWGVKKGRVYVTKGPVLHWEVLVGEERFYPGSFLPLQGWGKIKLCMQVADLVGGESLLIMVNGEMKKRVRIEAGLLEEELEIDRDYVWIRLEIRDQKNQLTTATNPVFAGERSPKIESYAEALEMMKGFKKL